MVSVRLEKSLVERIDRLADAEKASRSDVMDRAIRMGIADQEKLADAGPLMANLYGVLLSDPVLKFMKAVGGMDLDDEQIKRVRRLLKEGK